MAEPGVRRAEGALVAGPASAPSARVEYSVEGMCCASEVRQIEGKLGHHPGVNRLEFDPVNHRLTVEGEIAAAEVARAIAQLGMKARSTGEARVEESAWERHGRLLLAVASGLSWAGSLAAEYVLDSEWIAGTLAVAAIVFGGWYVIPRGVRAAMNRALDMNFLMSVAAVGAVLIGAYEEAASVMSLFAVAQLLETHSLDRARNAIRALMDLSPAEATVLREGREVRVPAERVGVGEAVLVRPGEKIPVDGEVVAGRSEVNQAPITGESVPVGKEPGAEVFAGTLNGEGALEVRSTRPAEDTTLARIIHSVEEAQSSRAPSQTFVERFARVYTPAVVLTAALLALLPPLLGLGAWGEWIYRALVLLVVACPCALAISTPVTVVSALAGAARRGILIKGGLHLENAGRARVVVLDKTGTLTEGRPAVVEVIALDGNTPAEVLMLAAAAEAHSEHPLARAILGYTTEQGLAPPTAVDTTAMPGEGVRARLDDQVIYVGSPRLFAASGALDGRASEALSRFEGQGCTAVLVGAAGVDVGGRPSPIGVIAIADRIRPRAAAALRDVRAAGVRRVVMLTGDNAGSARAVAEALSGGAGLDEFRAELLPADKVEAVRALRREHGTVLMVGDGVNDAPALATADVGVAMGTAGTDVALETADIALMADDLSKLATTVRFARKAQAIIRANIWFALVVKAVFVVLAVLGLATLWMAVFADMGASLLVVLNGMRALRD